LPSSISFTSAKETPINKQDDSMIRKIENANSSISLEKMNALIVAITIDNIERIFNIVQINNFFMIYVLIIDTQI
jgi:hypothetical protein